MPVIDRPAPSAESLATALSAVASGVAIVDLHGDQRALVHVNAAFAQITGYESVDALGGDLFAPIDAACDPAVERQLRDAVHAGRLFAGELLVRRRDGRSIWVRIDVRPVRDAARGLAQLVVTLEDISGHKQARESVRASEARLAVAMEASGLSMWDWDVLRDEVYYNEQWRHSLGIEPSELLRRTNLVDRLMLPANDPAVLAHFERHFNGGSPQFEHEYALPTRAGPEKWFLAHARVVRRDAAGKPMRVVGVLLDISLRKHNMRTARESQERWERAVRGTSDGLYDWDLASGYVWYAGRFREIIGYAAADFPDTFLAFQNVLHAEDRPTVLGRIRAHLENQAPLDVRCRVIRSGGAILWCRLRGQAERDAAGLPLRLAGSISDISAQIEAEDALSRSQDFYGTILDSLPLFIAYADRDERLVYANARFQEFFDQPLSRSRGRALIDVIGQQRYSAIEPFLRRALAGQTAEGQGRFRDAKGRTVDLDATFIAHRDEHGDIQGCFVAARDMTEKRQLEAELRQSQKMEAIGRLTGGIAHDFNNLLSVIVGNMQLLARSLRESPRLLRQADTALKAAMRGAELTRRLLTFARQHVLEPRIVDLNASIGSMYELLRRTLTGDIELQQRLDPAAWATRIDPSLLENAVLNLVINARDAMPQGGIIALSTRNVSTATREDGIEPGEYAVLEVADTGAGMSIDTLKRAFEPFFTTKDVGKGSGLGLSMVYGFVRQSGGSVRIDSTPGQGTRVHLYFPRSQGLVESASLDAGTPDALPRGGESILVVEDNAEVRDTAVDILGSLGYRVLEAANGHQALEQFMQHPDIALVFSDIMLPGGLLGTSLVQKLCERRPGLKVLLTTGFTESSRLNRGILDGSVEVLAKPYKVEDLARRVRAILEGNNEETHRVQA